MLEPDHFRFVRREQQTAKLRERILRERLARRGSPAAAELYRVIHGRLISLARSPACREIIPCRGASGRRSAASPLP